jgi:isoleucyl-tRNA synthetase
MRVSVPRAADSPRFRALLSLLAQEVNVRDVEVVASDADLVRLRAKPNFRALGKRYGKRTPAAAAAARRSPGAASRAGRGRYGELNGGADAWEYGPGISRSSGRSRTDWLVQSAGSYVAALDPELTEELRAEGVAREIVNRAQRLRKDAGYEYTTRIELWVDGPAALLEAVRPHAEVIRGETLARALQWARRRGPDRRKAVEIDGHR